jgi:uncharacterized membrane protein YgdD (TMEM256/DUF423 family)
MPANEAVNDNGKVSAFLRQAVAFGAAFAFLGIVFGAFGAHSLRESLGTGGTVICETAVRYQMYHAFALVMTGVLGCTPVGVSPTLRLALMLFVIGIVLFSGSLYVLAFTQLRWIGFVTPLGGLAFLGGWAGLFYSVIRRQPGVSMH